MLDLDHLAEVMGVRVVESPDLRADLNALYIHHRRRIIIRPDLDPYTRRAALAHELGHAYYGDDQADDPRLERRADQWAARLLITPESYAHAEHLHGPHAGAIAWELGVTPDLVRVWRGLHSRTPERTHAV